MKSNWPRSLNFKLIADGKAASNVLVYFILISTNKNNFTIGPMLTNNAGLVELTKDIMIKSIETHKQNYPMDYVDTLDSCIGIEILVESICELEKRINRLIEYYPQKATKLQNLVVNSSNIKFKGVSIAYKLPINNDQIILELELA